jgi:DNA-binding MarR family transcriptional regulator
MQSVRKSSAPASKPRPRAAAAAAGSPPPAIDSLRRLVQALRTSSHQAWNDLGVSGAQLFVLQQLEHASPLSLSALAERTHTHASSVSVVVARLVTRGLIARRAAADDARRAELSLTAPGKRLLASAPTPVQARLIEAIAALPARERSQLGRTLALLCERTGLASGPATMFFEEQEKSSHGA